MNQPPKSQSDGPGSGAPRYDPHPGLVALGTRVEVEMVSELGDSERLTFDIVPDRAADFTAGFLGAGTPLAQAIMGRPAGSDRAVPGRRYGRGAYPGSGLERTPVRPEMRPKHGRR